MRDLIGPPRPVQPQTPSRPLGDEQDRSYARQNPVARPRKNRGDLRDRQRRSGERRQFERRSEERRSDERRLDSRLSEDRRLEERRSDERRGGERRSTERRSVKGRLGRGNGKREAGPPSSSTGRRRGLIDDYA
ncbi:hypothetical protein CCR95_01040 [Thiocystis minor]|uniref:hypothetical protein n=1 Tax=Thiocystis minor TaxID=61597 RepID=UPI0019147577|nr:hypothetical protein [Thiocystis minor]MBK5962721.1 hypothetical protein [Thiocystis minor]